jgi:phenylpropionate dioxygenase-like ring-hydroxylating dioxygenase large terminal subunit
MDLKSIRLYVDDRPGEGVFRVHKDVYSDPELFELEMKYIFERTWNYLALESEIAKPNDFVTRHIGRTPVLVTRDAQGRVGAFINACRHKGATVCRLEEGNAKFHVCPYHGWAYDASGRNVDIKDRAAGAYAPAFEAENHDLLPVAKVASYKGLIFGSLSPDVPPLEEHLGDLKFFLDLHMEQSPNGMEVIPGRALYTYRGNWKMQMENGQDPYHVTSAHGSFFSIMERRRRGEGNKEARSLDWNNRTRITGGAFELAHGHCATWIEVVEPEKRPTYPMLDEIKARVGPVKAEWMLRQRNAVFFPNLQVADQIAPLLRIFRPIEVGLTELRSFVIAPVGEAPEVRARRLRTFEDFVNPGGYATPDDITVFADCQDGYQARGLDWLQGYERGMAVRKAGGNALAEAAGIRPVAHAEGPQPMCPEAAAMQGPLREWVRLMEAGLSGRKAYEQPG